MKLLKLLIKQELKLWVIANRLRDSRGWVQGLSEWTQWKRVEAIRDKLKDRLTHLADELGVIVDMPPRNPMCSPELYIRDQDFRIIDIVELKRK